jgi:hypothetical protein
MAELYDADGNVVEGAATPEHLKEIDAKVDKLAAALREKEEALKKYADKEFNFSQLRNKTQEEKDEVLKEYSEKEKTWINEISDLRGTVEDYHKVQMSSYEDEVIKAMVGDNEEQATKLKETAKEFVGTPVTKEDIFKRYKNAYTLMAGKQPSVNPINQFVPTSTSDSGLSSKKSGYLDTEEGQENFKRWFPDSPLNKKKE